jgi:putative oxidoreductase
MLLGRWLISAVFLVAALQKFLHWDATLTAMTEKAIPMPLLALACAAALELFGALALIFGARTRLAAAALFLFLIPVTWYFHAFWLLPPGEAQNLQLIMFLKNCAIAGGLLYLLAEGPGKLSRDHFRRKKTVEAQTTAEEA